MQDDYYLDPPIDRRSDTLKRVSPDLHHPSSTDLEDEYQPPPIRAVSREVSPACEHLLNSFAPHLVLPAHVLDVVSPARTDDSSTMPEPITSRGTPQPPPEQADGLVSRIDPLPSLLGADHASRPRAFSAATTARTDDRDGYDVAAVSTNNSAAGHVDEPDHTHRERVDSAHDSDKPPLPDLEHVRSQDSDRPPFPDNRLPRLEHGRTSQDSAHSPASLRHIVIPLPSLTLPVLAPQNSSPDRHDTSPTSPQSATKLPPFQRMQQLAEAATQDLQQQQQHQQQLRHHHTQSFGSASSQSPVFSHHTPLISSSQASPTVFPYTASSPSNATFGGAQAVYGSPTSQQPPRAYYTTDSRIPNPPERLSILPHHPPSLPSGSSGESHSGGTSNSEGYSTSHTTPSDVPLMADGPRILPPPVGMMVPPQPINIPGNFTCDHPGCNAAAFQTQYLLSSHKNVHSSSRPHYCPEKGCPRGEGGQGFKRKNEMIRHGLVHKSPGYICPYCPEREHKYPRPDNLQRHVRVHHTDKSKDDPVLQRVLSQRIEGATKARRRRTNGHVAGAAVASTMTVPTASPA